jgi:hypothetical protein
VSIKPAAAAAIKARPPRDSFGHKAPKLSALLGLSPEASVLFIGEDWNDWQEDLESYFPAMVQPRSLMELESILSSGSMYDLVLLRFRHGLGSSISVSQLLEDLRNKLAPTGSLFFVAENRVALGGIARNPLSLIASGRTTALHCRHRLSRFERVEEFLPLPRFGSAEEFVSSLHGETALPADASALEVGLARIGLIPFFNEGWAYIASSRQGGTSTIVEKIARALPATESGQKLVLERFDLRNRGALVLMLQAIATRHRFVCRIATDRDTDRSVRLNAEWIGRVRQAPAISAFVKQFLPAPLGSFSMPPGTGYIEELISGTIAWKIARNPRLECSLLGSLGNFSHRFSQDTAKQIRIDETVFGDLMKSAHALSMDQETRRLVANLETRLRNRVLGTDRWLVWAHGDFGYGNAIADPDTAVLRGIIDWDQGRVDLAGVDLMNFVVVREHSHASAPLVTSFQSVADRMVTKGFRGIDARLEYEDSFPLGQQGRLDVLACVALRIAHRAAIYAALFPISRAQTHSILRWACETLGQ